MATQIVMDHTGDTRHQFDPTDAAAVTEAETRFKKLTAPASRPRSGWTRARARSSGASTDGRGDAVHSAAQRRMTWVEMGLVLVAAVMTTGAGAIIMLVSGEGMQAASLQAEHKALALFRSWLSPGQSQQYNLHKHFEIIGSDTGTRYRIRHGRMMNIDELDSAGDKVCEWCFLPAGNLAVGDVMLAREDCTGDLRERSFGCRKPRLHMGPAWAAASPGFPRS